MAEQEMVQGEVLFAELAERLLADLSRSSRSTEEYKSKQAIIRRHLVPAFGTRPVREVNLAAVQRYKESQLERGLSRKTINNHLVVLRAAFSLAVSQGIIDAAPPIQSFALEAPDLQYLDFEAARALVRAADAEWRLMIILALRTGLRLGELRSLTWEHVDLDNMRLHVQYRTRERLEGSRRSREIPLSEDTVLELRQHPRRGPWVFCTEQGEMLTHGACKWPLYRAARRAGLQQLGWDVLRRTFAAHLTLRGAPLASVQALLGHRSLSTTLRYTQLGAQGARAAISLLDVKDPHGHASRWVRGLTQRCPETQRNPELPVWESSSDCLAGVPFSRTVWLPVSACSTPSGVQSAPPHERRWATGGGSTARVTRLYPRLRLTPPEPPSPVLFA